MKRAIILILFLFCMFIPLHINAKTPTREETMKIIAEIKNIQVDDDIKITSSEIKDNIIILNIEKSSIEEQIKVYYEWVNNTLNIYGGTILIDNSLVKDIISNDFAFYIYSILERESTIPYDYDNYYNNSNIKKIVESNINFTDKISLKEKTNTFGITLEKENNIINIIYQYHLDGDYPIIIFDDNELTENPNTGNFTTYTTFAFILIIGVACYTYMNPKKEKEEA